ncbi:MAG: hypothetical protein JSS31_07940 [Proteobacteria bacterium]|nr:hypothetical protein [Pseudomonadota bacterium]MBS0493881.1 hypothetical protein [Pseudomonadota bacterium]
MRQHDIAPHKRLEINGLMSIAAMVDQGLGISLLPDWSALWSSGLSIRKVPLPGRAPVRRSGIVWGAQSPHLPIARMFVEHAQALFGAATQDRG